MRQVFWAVHNYEIIPCPKPDDAHKAVAQYEIYTSQPDTF